jgi:hypothetical protein
MSSPATPEAEGAVATTPTMPRGTRYYYLHAEVQRAKQRDKYNSDPEVIRKREERAAKKAAKEAEAAAKLLEKHAKTAERQKKLQEKISLQ